jgi:hypothetical protein
LDLKEITIILADSYYLYRSKQDLRQPKFLYELMSKSSLFLDYSLDLSILIDVDQYKWIEEKQMKIFSQSTQFTYPNNLN